MALMTSSTTALAYQYQTVFNKKLLDHAKQLVVLDQFAVKSPFPKNAGAKTMRLFRSTAGLASDMSTLSEGVAITTYSEVALEYVEATLAQYGQVYKISDVLGLTELFSTLTASRTRMAESAALHADQIIRNAIVAGVSTNKLYAQGAASFAALSAATAGSDTLTIKDLLRAMTALEIARAPKYQGNYIAVVPPQIAYDLMLDTQWFIPVGSYQDKSNVIKGEVGTWYNVKVVKNTVPFRETSGGTEGTFAGSGTIYRTIVTGSDGYGTPIMAGNSPYSPQILINDKPDKTDPLNQYVLAGLKTYWAALVLNETWLATISSKTSYA